MPGKAPTGGKGAFSVVWPTGEQQVVRQVLVAHVDAIKDFRPIWNKFIPNIRRAHLVNFKRQADPITGAPWSPLSDTYLEYKERTAPAQNRDKILRYSGTLFRAASTKGGAGQYLTMAPRFFEFIVNIGKVYPSVHQRTARSRKDGTPLKRRWLGYGRTTLLNLRAHVEGHIAEMLRRTPARVSSGSGKGSAL